MSITAERKSTLIKEMAQGKTDTDTATDQRGSVRHGRFGHGIGDHRLYSSLGHLLRREGYVGFVA